MEQRRAWLWWALAGIVALWLLWMTFRPIQTVAADLAPLGVTLALALGDQPAGRRLLLALLIGASLSLTIEITRMTIPSRITAREDWLLNTTGTGIGALIGCRMTRRSFGN